MNEEYYIEYYDPKGRRGFTKYFQNKADAEFIKDGLKRNGYTEVKIITFRY